jgi:hypothetical protein
MGGSEEQGDEQEAPAGEVAAGAVENGRIQNATLDVLIEHNLHRWSVEEENARRLGLRSGQLLTLIAALLGFGVFKLGQEGPLLERVNPKWVGWIIILGLGLAQAFLLWALKDLLRVRRRPSWRNRTNASASVDMPDDPGETDAEAVPSSKHGPLASVHLAWPQDFAPESPVWEELDPDEAKVARYWSLERAASRLFQANVGAATANGRAQEWLFIVALILSFVLGCYLLVGQPGSNMVDHGGSTQVPDGLPSMSPDEKPDDEQRPQLDDQGLHRQGEADERDGPGQGGGGASKDGQEGQDPAKELLQGGG